MRERIRGLRGLFLADPEQLSTLAVVDFFATMSSAAEDGMYRIRGGNDRLATAIAGALRRPPRLNTILRAVRDCGFVVTVEEAALMTGFGSAVLEAATDAGLTIGRFRRLGIPDQFVEHGERGELLTDLGLDPAGIAAACRELANRPHTTTQPSMHVDTRH